MDTTELIGIIASVCTGISLLPQLIKVLKEKKADQLSWGMMAVLLVGFSLWIVYGIHKKDLIIVISNVVSLILNILIIFFSWKYQNKVQGQSGGQQDELPIKLAEH